MATERLHMNGEQPYHGYEAAAHVARYALARPLCAGRRVLDVACGEGYGSALLAGWGARHVVGIDISAAAIASANRHFDNPTIRFLQGDAEQAPALLPDEAPFDLVVSFETVEHVADPAALLRGLRRLCAPGGTLLVSCPNDPATLAPGAVNPFHMRTYTFAQFRDFAEAILGPASEWLIETPVVGLLHYRLGDAAAEVPAAGPADIVKARDAAGCLQLPAQDGDAPSAQDCLAYVGIWGSVSQPSCAVSPMSHTGYMFPWHKLDRLEQEIDRLNREQQEDRRQLLHYAETVAALRQSPVADQERIRQLTETIERQRAQIGTLEGRTADLEAQIASLAAQNQQATQQIAVSTQRAAALEQRRNAAEATLAALTVEFAARGSDLTLARQWREGMERSHFYRMLQAYVGLYRLPVIGPALGMMRRVAALLLGGARRG